MPTLLIKHAYLVTMDDHQREIPDGGLFIRDGFIEQVGETKELPIIADEVVDLTGHLLLPGLVNTHHHFYQTLTRAIPAAQDANLFNWLTTLYPIWARMNPEDIFTSAQTALAELALSGCTTASDHLYLFPNSSKLDDEIAAKALLIHGKQLFVDDYLIEEAKGVQKVLNRHGRAWHPCCEGQGVGCTHGRYQRGDQPRGRTGRVLPLRGRRRRSGGS